MIPQLKRYRMRVEIELFFEIRLIVLSDIMIDKRYWYNEGQIPFSITISNLKQFFFSLR